MKPSLFVLLALWWLPLNASAFNEAQVDAFVSGFAAALQAQDLQAINRFYYTKDVDQFQLEILLSGTFFRDDFADNTFGWVHVLPLDDPELDAKTVQSVTREETLNGQRYGPNLKPVAICKVHFGPGRKKYESDATMALGEDPDGNLKIVMQKLVGGTPIFALAQTKLDGFKAAVEAALQARNFRALGSLFCTRGITQHELDLMIGVFEDLLAKQTFDSVKIQSFDDPSLFGPGVNRAAIVPSAKGETARDGSAPNLQPLFLCTIAFKPEQGRIIVDRSEWVGLDPDGQYRFTMSTRGKAAEAMTRPDGP